MEQTTLVRYLQQARRFSISGLEDDFREEAVQSADTVRGCRLRLTEACRGSYTGRGECSRLLVSVRDVSLTYWSAYFSQNGREYHGTVLQVEFHRAYKAKPRSKAGKVQRPDENYARLVVHGEERAPEAAPSAANQNVAAVPSSAIAVDDELTPVGDTLPAQVEDRRNRASGNQPSVGATGVPLPKLSIPPSTSSPADIAGLSRNPSRPIILGTPMRPSVPSKLRGLGFRHRSLSDSHARAEEPLAFLAPRATQGVTAACQADHTLALRENSGMTASSSGSSLKTGTTSVTGGGRRVVSWSPAMNPEMSNEDSEVSSPDVNSVSSEGGAMGERQTVVTTGPWPYGVRASFHSQSFDAGD